MSVARPQASPDPSSSPFLMIDQGVLRQLAFLYRYVRNVEFLVCLHGTYVSRAPRDTMYVYYSTLAFLKPSQAKEDQIAGSASCLADRLVSVAHPHRFGPLPFRCSASVKDALALQAMGLKGQLIICDLGLIGAVWRDYPEIVALCPYDPEAEPVICRQEVP